MVKVSTKGALIISTSLIMNAVATMDMVPLTFELTDNDPISLSLEVPRSLTDTFPLRICLCFAMNINGVDYVRGQIFEVDVAPYYTIETVKMLIWLQIPLDCGEDQSILAF